MCGELGLSESGIALCLDHQANKDETGKALSAITRKVYNRATLSAKSLMRGPSRSSGSSGGLLRPGCGSRPDSQEARLGVAAGA